MQKTCFVYLFIDTHGRTKIGVSQTPELRKTSVANFVKRSIEIHSTYECGSMAFKVESYLHKHFKDKCISGEWFNLTEEDRLSVEGLITEYFSNLKAKETRLAAMEDTVQSVKSNCLHNPNFKWKYSTDIRKEVLATKLHEAKSVGVKLNRKQLAEEFGVSKRTIISWISQLDV